ncbi:hypothetical protein ACWD5V_14755 [Streptomyces sp. NPDC002523]
MTDPVFVIHGVANRDRDGFTAAVAALQAATGISMMPVYWGDLGADERFVSAALPIRPVTLPRAQQSGGLRDANDPPGISVPEPLLASALTSDLQVTNQWTHVETVVRERLTIEEQQSDSGLRNTPHYGDADELLAYLAEEWPKTEWLSRTDDPLLLFETGQSLAEALIEAGDLWATNWARTTDCAQVMKTRAGCGGWCAIGCAPWTGWQGPQSRQLPDA